MPETLDESNALTTVEQSELADELSDDQVEKIITRKKRYLDDMEVAQMRYLIRQMVAAEETPLYMVRLVSKEFDISYQSAYYRVTKFLDELADNDVSLEKDFPKHFKMIRARLDYLYRKAVEEEKWQLAHCIVKSMMTVCKVDNPTPAMVANIQINSGGMENWDGKSLKEQKQTLALSLRQYGLPVPEDLDE